MPTHRVVDTIRHDALLLKNLLSEAERRLREAGAPADVADRVLSPARGLIEDYDFWQHQADGLGLLLDEAGASRWFFPYSVPPLVTVGHQFHIKPLVPLVAERERYFALCIGKGGVHLYRGTRAMLEEMPLEGIPRNLAAVLQWDDPERQLQYRSGVAGSGGRGRRAAIFHGHGAGKDDPRSTLLKYFQAVDRGVQRALRNETAPLVLVGVDYLAQLYRGTTQYAPVTNETVPHNPDDMDVAGIHRATWAVAEAYVTAERLAAAARFEEVTRSGRGKGTNDLEDVLAAALDGRVDTLFVALDRERWGTWDAESRRPIVHGQPEAADHDLLNTAATLTLACGGTVYVVPDVDVPGEQSVAALLRY